MVKTEANNQRDVAHNETLATVTAGMQPATPQALTEAQVAAVSGGPETVIGSGTNPPH